MIRLFVRFDLFFFSLQYIFYFLFLITLFRIVYKFRNLNLFLNFGWMGLRRFINTLKPKSFVEFRFGILVSLFNLILIFNFTSILSYRFSFTSQTRVVIFIAFRIWVSFFLFQTLINIKGFLSHCIPEGTPIYLTWFLFLIELISNFIRPVTLRVRLVANILAGHLLMILLSKLVLKILILFPLYLILNLVELFVALIQSYIFMTIMTLYFSDVN